MAFDTPYASLAELKAYAKIPETKEGFDDILEDALDSTTNEINQAANRQFNKTDTATERAFYPTGNRLCFVDDFYTTENLVLTVADEVWTDDMYELQPLNGVVSGQPGWPYWIIKALDGRCFPLGGWAGEAPVLLTAKWGWNAVPNPIKQACLIMAAETFSMKDAPFGVAGMDQFGTPLRVRDNRIAAGKIARYTRDRVKVG